jgi:RNA polymerase sigma-70 factor (ECF subfamily)
MSAESETAIRDACSAGRWAEAVTVALHMYGDEILGYLVAMTRDEAMAKEAFSVFGEMVWKGLPRFRWECAFRTWGYQVARHALGRVRRDAHRRRAVPLDDDHVAGMVAQIRSRTATFLRTASRDKLAALRAEMSQDDQTLLVLRINRKLPWQDIARVLSDGDEDSAAITRRSAALRKRFERLKAELRARMGE